MCPPKKGNPHSIVAPQPPARNTASSQKQARWLPCLSGRSRGLHWWTGCKTHLHSAPFNAMKQNCALLLIPALRYYIYIYIYIYVGCDTAAFGPRAVQPSSQWQEVVASPCSSFGQAPRACAACALAILPAHISLQLAPRNSKQCTELAKRHGHIRY